MGLIGQNGAGKSTSIRLIMGYMTEDEGSVSVLGFDHASPKVRRRIGYLPETSSFPANLTCMELLRFAGQCCDMQKKEILAQSEILLKKLGIWGDRNRRLSQYSKGMQQRASFAAALIHDPELLILDEPMSGLDPIGRAEIIGLIQDLQAQGKSILFCSHLLDDVERITNQVAILHKGDLLYDGKIDDLCAMQSEWLIELKNGQVLTVDNEQGLPALLKEHADTVLGVRRAKESLQDAFVRVVEGVTS
ncbi:MAG: ABC transporter ATP-binding protein [Ghiorsea sp.]|nr:ABC transporter ATP-binding protein [Ghiorsea sp.]